MTPSLAITDSAPASTVLAIQSSFEGTASTRQPPSASAASTQWIWVAETVGPSPSQVAGATDSTEVPVGSGTSCDRLPEAETSVALGFEVVKVLNSLEVYIGALVNHYNSATQIRQPALELVLTYLKRLRAVIKACEQDVRITPRPWNKLLALSMKLWDYKEYRLGGLGRKMAVTVALRTHYNDILEKCKVLQKLILAEHLA
jgi:hypothetical protein